MKKFWLKFRIHAKFRAKKSFISNEFAISCKTGFVLIRKWCGISCQKKSFRAKPPNCCQKNWLFRGNPSRNLENEPFHHTFHCILSSSDRVLYRLDMNKYDQLLEDFLYHIYKLFHAFEIYRILYMYIIIIIIFIINGQIYIQIHLYTYNV